MTASTPRKLDATVLAALITVAGSIIVALISSPFLKSWLDRTPTPTPPAAGATDTPVSSGAATIVFQNNFDNGSTSGFAFNGLTGVLKKDKSNQVLELDASTSAGGSATFGSNDFSNGSIEFKLELKNTNDLLLDFRTTSAQRYTVDFSPSRQVIQLGYSSGSDAGSFQLFAGQGSRPFQFNTGIWYSVKLEAAGAQMTVWMDGNKILSSQDTRLTRGALDISASPGASVWLDDVKVTAYSQ
jgi:hypothetical protein